MNEAARIAAELTLRALSSLQERVNKGETLSNDDLGLLLSADVRGWVKEAQDRAHGTPKQAVEHTGKGGGALETVTRVEIVSVVPHRTD